MDVESGVGSCEHILGDTFRDEFPVEERLENFSLEEF